MTANRQSYCLVLIRIGPRRQQPLGVEERHEVLTDACHAPQAVRRDLSAQPGGSVDLVHPERHHVEDVVDGKADFRRYRRRRRGPGPARWSAPSPGGHEAEAHGQVDDGGDLSASVW